MMTDRTTLNIIHVTGRVPCECRCERCRNQCRTPCLGTPQDILRLVESGYGNRLEPSLWAVGMMLGRFPFPIPMIQARQESDGFCTFFHDGLCELHSLGLKPTEGTLSHHSITIENLDFSRSLTWNVARTWLDARNEPVVAEIVRKLMKQL